MKKFPKRIPNLENLIPPVNFKSYKSLEAEFTKRCQKLKELEENNAKLENKLQELSHSAERVLEDEEFIESRVLRDSNIVNKIIAEYLSSLSNPRGAPTLSSNLGRSALTPVKKPKSLEEAKKLAEILFKA